jgi:hypothetical protein
MIAQRKTVPPMQTRPNRLTSPEVSSRGRCCGWVEVAAAGALAAAGAV